MYEDFKRFEIQTSDPEVKIVGCVGGQGPGVLLLRSVSSYKESRNQ